MAISKWDDGAREEGTWSRKSCPATFDDVNCSVCHKQIQLGQPIVDAFIYEFDGSLDYIELAHEACARQEENE
jgi:hypothetical protein